MPCVICNKTLELVEAFTCGTTECEIVARTMNLGDEYVSNYLKSDPEIVKFLLDLSEKALLAAKTLADYQPSPTFLGETPESSFQLLKAISINLAKMWPKLSKMTSDQAIENEYGLVIYGWIRFSLKSSLLKLTLDPTLKIPDLLVIRVEHFLEDVPFKQTQSQSLETQRLFFHGSSNLNWYSIINRGLKNYSGTAKGIHGAVYGKGIYLATTSQLSLAYCFTDRGTMVAVLGVFEILAEADKYQKSDPTVYVVPDETKVRIRYLIVGDYTNLSESSDAIDHMFSIEVGREKSYQKQITNQIKNKRLLHEIKYFSQTDLNHYGIRCQFNDHDMTIWSVFLSGFEETSGLAKDLTKIKQSEIEMEIRFPTQFPLKPPFVRVVRPRFEFRTGHITLGGSICLELLTNQGWSPTYSLENLIIHVKSVILGGEGRIDMKRWSEPYTYSEATDAFQRMVLSHGWN